MGVLRSLEGKLERLVEGVFTKTFKSKVQPVELARKLVKEMQEHKTVSVSRTYVPNEYIIYLSDEDMQDVESYESALQSELSTYLLEHARKEGLSLLTRPAISFEMDERLGLGEFGIQTRLVKPPTEDEEEAEQGALGHTMVYTSLRDRVEDEDPSKQKGAVHDRAYLLIDGKRFVIDGTHSVLGRSRSCDIAIQDPNISRRHAELTKQGEHWFIADLESTNGVQINDRKVSSSRLAPGDNLILGTTHIVFEVER